MRDALTSAVAFESFTIKIEGTPEQVVPTTTVSSELIAARLCEM
jgi:hypothetical protein